MIFFKQMVWGMVPVRTIWFATTPGKNISLHRFYKQCSSQTEYPGYLRKPFFTKVIDLTKSLAEIEGEMDKQTIYEYKRGVRDGIVTAREHDLTQFTIFYNLFAHHKNRPPLGNRLRRYQKNLVITKAMANDTDLVMHAYIIDEAASRVRLLYSATSAGNDNQAFSKAFFGRANRLLHYSDICLFKELGYSNYDLGGYAVDTNDEALIGINKFKDSFGGRLIEESDYFPLPFKILSNLTTLF